MTDDEIDKLHDSIDCWSGFGLGARFDHRAFARKVEQAAREQCAELCDLYEPLGREGPETVSHELALAIRGGA